MTQHHSLVDAMLAQATDITERIRLLQAENERLKAREHVWKTLAAETRAEFLRMGYRGDDEIIKTIDATVELANEPEGLSRLSASEMAGDVA